MNAKPLLVQYGTNTVIHLSKSYELQNTIVSIIEHEYVTRNEFYPLNMCTWCLVAGLCSYVLSWYKLIYSLKSVRL